MAKGSLIGRKLSIYIQKSLSCNVAASFSRSNRFISHLADASFSRSSRFISHLADASFFSLSQRSKFGQLGLGPLAAFGCRKYGNETGKEDEETGEEEEIATGKGITSFPLCTPVGRSVDVSSLNLKSPWTKQIAFNVRHQGEKALCWSFTDATLGEYTYKILNPKRQQVMFSALRIAECMWPQCPPRGFCYHIIWALHWLSGKGFVCMDDGPDTIYCNLYMRSPQVERYMKQIKVRSIGSLAELKELLLTQPAACGIWVDDSFSSLQPGMVYEGPIDTHKPRQHAVVIIASEVYDGQEVLIIQNSWGTRWCDNGFGRILSQNLLYVTGAFDGVALDEVCEVYLVYSVVAIDLDRC